MSSDTLNRREVSERMFKKAVEAKSHQRLSGADRKKLRRSIKDKFPRVSDSDLDALLPPKVNQIINSSLIHSCFFVSFHISYTHTH